MGCVRLSGQELEKGGNGANINKIRKDFLRILGLGPLSISRGIRSIHLSRLVRVRKYVS